jgi:hypothetical protein
MFRRCWPKRRGLWVFFLCAGGPVVVFKKLARKGAMLAESVSLRFSLSGFEVDAIADDAIEGGVKAGVRGVFLLAWWEEDVGRFVVWRLSELV